MANLAILGGKGMLGSDLVRYLSTHYEVSAIDRDNYEEYRGKQFDILVNANGNSRRFWANENPLADFEASTVSVMKSLFDFTFGKYIYISSPDAYADPSSPATTHEDAPGDLGELSPYGFHKRLSEELVRHYAKDWLIVRPSAILGTQLTKGMVHDVLQGNELFVTLDSKLQFITTDAVADIIETLLQKSEKGIFNVGGRGTVTPEGVGALVKKPIRVRTDAARQEYEMNTEKIENAYGALKTSGEYVRIFIETQRAGQPARALDIE